MDDKKRPRHRLTERQIEAMMASSAKRRNYDYRTRRDMRYREAEIEEEEARAANRLLKMCIRDRGCSVTVEHGSRVLDEHQRALLKDCLLYTSRCV